MKLLLLLLVLVVVGLVVAVAAGSITGGLGDPARSTPDPGPPPGPVRAQDLEQVRFAPALRGYRMDQVDALLDRLRDQLATAEEEARRARLARLVGHPAGAGSTEAGDTAGPEAIGTDPFRPDPFRPDPVGPDAAVADTALHRPDPLGPAQDPAAGPAAG